ncbi:MAG: hypothetical protein V4644_02395 [Patescibacteria group bacterium]
MHKTILPLLTLALMFCLLAATGADAQEPDPVSTETCRSRTVADETVMVCGQELYQPLTIGGRNVLVRIESEVPDLSTCQGGTIAGRRIISCAGVLYQWERVGERLRIARVPVLSAAEADQALMLERYSERNYRQLCYEAHGGYSSLTCLDLSSERSMREHCMNRYGISTRSPLYYRAECDDWRHKYESARLQARIAN